MYGTLDKDIYDIHYRPLQREYMTLILNGLDSRSRLLHWVSLKSSTVPSIDRKNTLFAHYWQTEFEKSPAHIQDGFFSWERFRMNVSIESHWKHPKIQFLSMSASLTKFMVSQFCGYQEGIIDIGPSNRPSNGSSNGPRIGASNGPSNRPSNRLFKCQLLVSFELY